MMTIIIANTLLFQESQAYSYILTLCYSFWYLDLDWQSLSTTCMASFTMPTGSKRYLILFLIIYHILIICRGFVHPRSDSQAGPTRVTDPLELELQMAESGM